MYSHFINLCYISVILKLKQSFQKAILENGYYLHSSETKALWSKYHQHFMSNFFANFLLPKHYKCKMLVQKSCVKHLCSKKLLVKCWQNWPLEEVGVTKLKFPFICFFFCFVLFCHHFLISQKQTNAFFCYFSLFTPNRFLFILCCCCACSYCCWCCHKSWTIL